MSQFLEIALPVPLRNKFTYLASAELPQVQPGCRVIVDFAGRQLTGIVLNGTDAPPANLPESKVKPVNRIIDTRPLLSLELLSLCTWVANYYQSPIGEVLAAATPQYFRDGKTVPVAQAYRHTRKGLGLPVEALKNAKGQQAIHQFLLQHKSLPASAIESFSKSAMKSLEGKGLIEKAPLELPVVASDISTPLLNENPKNLNEEQQIVFAAINYHKFESYLINGATGSGKTEIYLQVVARVLQSGKQALVLIPEIGLTPQTIKRFQQRFNVEIAQLHSNIAEKERAESWHKAKTGKAKIVIGTRLASLTPFKNLGVIIVDEEHDRSYKQQDGVRYSARDLSIYRAHSLNIPIILGTATPSLETLNNALTGRYQHLTLRKRAGNATPPEISRVDLRDKSLLFGLTPEALTDLDQAIQRQEHALIFLNRRGFAPALLCHHCGWSADCGACETRMTFHRNPWHLRCHHCNRSRPMPKTCPACSSDKLLTSGIGTEQVEVGLKEKYPNTPIVRIDSDTTGAKQSMKKLLDVAEDSRPCIFIGTQMLAKGHHLPNLTLVVIADADQGLLSPDFRSLEHMGQLIIQVAGRPGREEKPGKVIVQSHRPDHPMLTLLLEEGYEAFAKQLLKERNQSQLPPFSHFALFRAESKRAEICVDFLQKVGAILSRLSEGHCKVVGPHPSALEKVNDRYRFCLQISSGSRPFLQQVLTTALEEIDHLAEGKRARWSLDVDALVVV